MIIIYLNPNQSKKQYDEKLNEMLHLIEAYHFGDVTIVTDKSLHIIRDIVSFYKPYQFSVHSVYEFDSSPTMVSELILYMVNKLDITFTSIDDKLYFDQDNILEIYPKVFEQFKKSKES